MQRLMMTGVMALIGLTAIVACGDDDDTASQVQEANAAFCQDLAAHRAAVQSLADLDPASTTADDYQAAVDAVSASREDLLASGADLSDAGWTNLQAQLGTLKEQLQDAPPDAEVATVLADAQAQAATVRASIATVDTAVCAGGDSTTTTG